MLIYNTTYQVEEGQEDNFLIWIKEFYLPEVEKNGLLRAPRLVRVLSHREEGVRLNEELLKIFKDKVVGFPTLMEVIE